MCHIFYNHTHGRVKELNYMLLVWLLAFFSEEQVCGDTRTILLPPGCYAKGAVKGVNWELLLKATLGLPRMPLEFWFIYCIGPLSVTSRVSFQWNRQSAKQLNSTWMSAEISVWQHTDLEGLEWKGCKWDLHERDASNHLLLFLCFFQVLVLFGRAVNIFPLSYLLNFFRDHKITPKMMFIMWFSGKLKLKVRKTGKNVVSCSLCGLFWEESVSTMEQKSTFAPFSKPRAVGVFSALCAGGAAELRLMLG